MKNIILILLLMQFEAINAQNWLTNGDFEQHRSLYPYGGFNNNEEFAAIMRPWRNMSGWTSICDVNYQKSNDELQRTDCPFDKVKPHSGSTMIQLSYHASCLDGMHRTRGCAGYIATTLPKPMEIGKNYELSFWINILPPDEPDYVQHIGGTFFPKMFASKYGAMLEGAPFLLDTVIFNQWYQVKWRVKPTCNLQCFAIGVFRGKNGPEVNGLDHDNFFFVDDVVFQEIKEDTLGVKQLPKAFCKYESVENDAQIEEINGTVVYYGSGDSLLTNEDMLALDSFALRLKGHAEAVYTIEGYTDNVGSAHLSLSNARVESVLTYLEKQHQIPRFRFIPFYNGDKNPTADNSTEIGRSQNRRVEINQLTANLPDVIYRNVLMQVFEGNNDLAFRYLEKWLLVADVKKNLLMQNDPRIEPLKKDKKWPLIVNKVRKSYQFYKKPALAYALDSLWIEDQRGRTLEKYIENLQTYLIRRDSSEKRWDVFFPYDTGAVYEKNTQYRIQKISKIIDKHGWPKTSEVGKRAAKAAFVCFAHTEDTVLLKKTLPLLEKSCKEGEAEWIYYATILDHYLMKIGKPQKYGTQYKIDPLDEDKLELFPLENEELVNKWRSEIGLEALSRFKR
jgi:outer membrane protein OmpA-like peptidoglycan-associated protein